MDQPPFFPVRVDEKAERVVELVQGAAFRADEPEPNRGSGRTREPDWSISSVAVSSPGPAGQPSAAVETESSATSSPVVSRSSR